MTTEMNAERLDVIKNDSLVDALEYQLDMKKEGPQNVIKDVKWLIQQAERALELEEAMKGAHIVLNIETSDRKRFQDENARLRELVKTMKLHAVHCDSDRRAIQPYEIIDVINEFVVGDSDD